MKISTRGRYGLRAMIDLAKNDRGEPIPLREISERQEISEQYLEQLFASLRRSGLVRSVRGARGGYRLNRSPEEIAVGDILRVLEGPIAPVECVLGDDQCNRYEECPVQELWERLRNCINNVLDNTTLEELKDNDI